MKQIELNQRIIQMIKNAVGEDVDLNGVAVFEAIALNTNPLPGKDGGLFEKARISLLTLQQMADSINGGNHLPLVSNHDLDGTPKGRVFHAKVMTGDSGEGELRVLFYVDGTEEITKAKLNSASLDEVSVNFLASQILCSECSFDYRGEDAGYENLLERTCENGHKIGEDGVHVRLVGLSVFTELSLVSRGAADNPKIVGKSQSKLAAPLQQLAAKGFEVDGLYLSASKGEKTVDTEKLVASLADTQADLKVALRDQKTAEDQVTQLTETNESLTTELAETKQALEDAKAANNADELDTANTQLSEAREVLGEIYVKLATAAGEENPEAPEEVASLKEGIEKYQSKLTAILPVDGVTTDNAGKPDVGAKFRNTAGFRSGR